MDNLDLKRLVDNTSLTEILIQIEDYLDGLDLYVFENWIKGEIVKGPNIERYWISISLKYSMDEKPDPKGASRLKKYGTHIKTKKIKEDVPVVVESPDDIDPVTKQPKTTSEDFLIVELQIPRRFIEELDLTGLEAYDDEVDMEHIEDAQEEGIQDDDIQMDDNEDEGLDL